MCLIAATACQGIEIAPLMQEDPLVQEGLGIEAVVLLDVDRSGGSPEGREGAVPVGPGNGGSILPDAGHE